MELVPVVLEQRRLQEHREAGGTRGGNAAQAVVETRRGGVEADSHAERARGLQFPGARAAQQGSVAADHRRQPARGRGFHERAQVVHKACMSGCTPLGCISMEFFMQFGRRRSAKLF